MKNLLKIKRSKFVVAVSTIYYYNIILYLKLLFIIIYIHNLRVICIAAAYFSNYYDDASRAQCT